MHSARRHSWTDWLWIAAGIAIVVITIVAIIWQRRTIAELQTRCAGVVMVDHYGTPVCIPGGHQ